MLPQSCTCHADHPATFIMTERCYLWQVVEAVIGYDRPHAMLMSCLYASVYCRSCHVKRWQVKQQSLLLCSIKRMVVVKTTMADVNTLADVKVNTGGLSKANLRGFLDRCLWIDTSMKCSDRMCLPRWNSVQEQVLRKWITSLSLDYDLTCGCFISVVLNWYIAGVTDGSWTVK